MLRKAAFFLTILFAFSLSAFAQAPAQKQVTMPDFTKWKKTGDHTSNFLYKGVETKVRDQHYEYVNPEQTEASVVMEWYNPETGKPWFALYFHGHIQGDQMVPPLEAYLYEPDDHDGWRFVQDVAAKGALTAVLKSRYHIEDKPQ